MIVMFWFLVWSCSRFSFRVLVFPSSSVAALAACLWWVRLGVVFALARVRCSRRPWTYFPSRAEMVAAACAGAVRFTKANPFRSPVSWSIGRLVSVSGLNFLGNVPTFSLVVE